jgi:soluble cytochrome b562
MQHYPLLLQAILKNTTALADELQNYDLIQEADELTDALKRMQACISEINRQVTESNKAKVYSIQASLEFSHSWQKIDLVKENQDLLFEGEVKLKDGRVRYHDALS